MSRQERRRQQRLRGPERQARPRWLLWTAGGMVCAVALVLILLVATGVFGGRESSPASIYMLTSKEVAQLASTGHSLGSPSAPVTILEFGDFQ